MFIFGFSGLAKRPLPLFSSRDGSCVLLTVLSCAYFWNIPCRKPAPKNISGLGSCHKRKKPQAPTPQAPIRNRQTRKVANAKGLNRNTNLT